MVKIDIVSGFLGAGKTTLIKKLLKEGLNGQKVVLIENEFGEIGIDGGFLKEAGIEIREMNSGCICCSLVGDFGASLKEVIEKYQPERILIEPSGVGKLSDVMKAVEGVKETGSTLNSAVAIVDAIKCKMYVKNFGEFFINQIENAGTIVLSRTDKLSEEKIQLCVELIRRYNTKATIITTPWEQLEGSAILEAIEKPHSLEQEMMEECGCNHHHHHDQEEECGCDHHHHDQEEECGCDHDHHDHHHHHADEVFTSWGFEAPICFSERELKEILEQLEKEDLYGMVLRAKGMIKSSDTEDWIYFDYVPGEMELRKGKPDYTGKICVIGSKLKENALSELFHK
ncbi:MAG: GTP-binding protein [Acetivibrio sp.]